MWHFSVSVGDLFFYRDVILVVRTIGENARNKYYMSELQILSLIEANSNSINHEGWRRNFSYLSFLPELGENSL